MSIQDRVVPKSERNFAPQTTHPILRRMGVLANSCLKLVEPPLMTVAAKLFGRNTLDSKSIFDLEQAETMMGIDRQILLTAIANHQLPASLTADRYYIKYKDLERFVDRYYYQKNPILGTYCVRSKVEF
jgi:hypothetical protein